MKSDRDWKAEYEAHRRNCDAHHIKSLDDYDRDVWLPLLATVAMERDRYAAALVRVREQAQKGLDDEPATGTPPGLFGVTIKELRLGNIRAICDVTLGGVSET